jgi:hypothetical protein
LGTCKGGEGIEEARRWCADFVEKKPVVEGVQRRRSLSDLRDIFIISKTVPE